MKPETNRSAACTAPATKTENRKRKQKTEDLLPSYLLPSSPASLRSSPARAPFLAWPFSLSRQSVSHPSVIHHPHVRKFSSHLTFLSFLIPPPLSLSKISFRSKPNQPGQLVSPASARSHLLQRFTRSNQDARPAIRPHGR